MREIEMGVETLETIARQMRIAIPMFDQFPFLNTINVGTGEEFVGQIVRDSDFTEGCRFVLNAEFFEVPERPLPPHP